MARKHNIYPGQTGRCQVARIGEHEDTWCVYHAAYLLDCLECGRNFHTDRPHTSFCSNKCKQKSYRQRLKVQTA